jgi:hypothetical protein
LPLFFDFFQERKLAYVRRDQRYVQALSDELARQYGEKVVQPIDDFVTECDRAQIARSRKEFDQRSIKKKKETEKIDAGGFLISKKARDKKRGERTCPVCNKFSFYFKDDIYMARYQCCENCFIVYVEGREERWKSGWRPNESASKTAAADHQRGSGGAES